MYEGLLAEIASKPNPIRTRRRAPRCVKRKMSNYARKKTCTPSPARCEPPVMYLEQD
jgi:hypothetical protein